MTVDILLATFNGAKYLDEQLQSIYNQTFTKWHLHVHDDGSSDETINIIRKHVAKHPESITFYDDDISTGSAKENFNYLLQKSSSEYVMFCDQDDYWLVDKIELTYNEMKRIEENHHDSPLLVYTDLSIVDENLKVIADSMWNFQNITPKSVSTIGLFFENYITGCTVMINAKLRDVVGVIPEEALIHDWWTALIVSITGTISFVDQPTILYRQHALNDTGAKNYSPLTILNLLLNKHHSIITHLLSLSTRIYNQNHKLYKILSSNNTQPLNCNFLILKEQVTTESIIGKKIIMIRKKMLTGNLIKKIAKLIFYK